MELEKHYTIDGLLKHLNRLIDADNGPNHKAALKAVSDVRKVLNELQAITEERIVKGHNNEGSV